MHGYNVQEALFSVQALGRGQYGQILIKSLEIPFFSPKYIIEKLNVKFMVPGLGVQSLEYG